MTNGRPRRRSIFSGLLLILAGALLLYDRFHGGLPIWQFLERWWPLILIIWGLAKLVDHFAARQTGQAAPATITGGEIALVILVLALVATVGTIEWGVRGGNVDVSDWGCFWSRTPYSFSEELPATPVPANARITIRTDRGDITVHAEDAAEIRVSVKKAINASDEGEAKRRAQQVNAVVRHDGDSYEVVTEGAGGQGRVDLEVHVPRQASITAQTPRGDIQLSGIQGNVIAEASRGDIEVRDAGGDVSAQIGANKDVHIVGAKGNVKLTGRASQVEIADVAGDVSIQCDFFGGVLR